MPLVFRQNIDNTELILWQIDESEEQLYRFVTQIDIESASRFSNSCRRKEHLAWRAALRSVVPEANIAYNEVGAPYLVSDDRSIGVSHTDGMVAVCISKNGICSVDVESLERDFTRASSRFITDAERRLPACCRDWFEAVVWCAKECAYKYSSRKELDLKKDINVMSVDEHTREILVDINGLGVVQEKFLFFDNFVVVHI